MQTRNSAEAAGRARDVEKGLEADSVAAVFASPIVVPVASPFGISLQDLNALSSDKDAGALKALGGQERLAEMLGSDAAHGLDTKAADWRSLESHRDTYGANELPATPAKSFLWLAYQTLLDPIMLLLVGAALILTILGSAINSERHERVWIEGMAIWIVVIIVTCVGAGNDWSKDRQFRALSAAKDVIQVKVLRNKEQTTILTQELCVGDIVLLDSGDRVLADGILIDSMGLVLDEAALTGESEPIKKSRQDDPWIRSGANVDEGNGHMVVVAVGVNSEWGKALALVTEAGDDLTPLQVKLKWLAKVIGTVGFSVAIACFLALMIKWMVVERGFPLNKVVDGPVKFFVLCITIIVVGIPEGLPLAVTMSLAYSMRKMMEDNNFVRVLAACETMGSATAICSDKTGTLTENRMTVVEGWFGGAQHSRCPAKEDVSPELLDTLCDVMALSSKAYFDEEEGRPMKLVGNRTECALLALMRTWDVDYRTVREQHHDEIFRLYGFTSARKMSCVLVHRPDGGLRVLNKGAAEWVLRKCTNLMDTTGQVVPMTECVRAGLEETVTAMAARGLRCIALSCADISAQQLTSLAEGHWEDVANVDRDLTLLCVVGIKDPVREEVPHAVEVCQRAGITVRMVTGDNIHTAQHIARECGILTEEDHIALEGPAFRVMTEEQQVEMLSRLRVLARSSPEDKLTLVRLLKKQGEVVAVTGDGTNDAPALKESDVGLAMGIVGTEVAKAAADIIIMDDNFRSIVSSVLWGRSVFSNIRKFLQFQLTVNVVALLTVFIGAVAGGQMPLTVLQLLWVNLLMSTMGALALATGPPTPELLLQKPNDRNTPLISRCMWKHILVQGLYQLFWLMFLLYALPAIQIHTYRTENDLDQSQGLSILFNAFICMTVANEICARRIRDEYDIFSGLLQSPVFSCVILITCGLQAVIMQFLGSVFKVSPLNWQEWLVCILIGLGTFPVSYLTRFISRSIYGAPFSVDDDDAAEARADTAKCLVKRS